MPKKTNKKSVRVMTLLDLLVNKLSVLYDIEKQLVKALPKMAKAANDKELAQGFLTHLKETETHVRRLEGAFDILKTKPVTSLKSAGIRGIIEDGEWVIKNIEDKGARDSNLIAAASYAEHYEMAGYRAAKEWAEELGCVDVAELLDQTLAEEIAADQKMAFLGMERINPRVNPNPSPRT